MLGKSSGFTLLEMIVVLVIIGLLASLVGPRLFQHADRAKVQTAEIQIKMIKGALQTLKLDIGRLPTDQEGLSILSQSPQDDRVKRFWKGPYLDESVPLDPWNNPYIYKSQKSEGYPFTLYSLGADGQEGGEEDNADIGFKS